MSSSQNPFQTPGKKRKHEEDGESSAVPAKKKKRAARRERKKARKETGKAADTASGDSISRSGNEVSKKKSSKSERRLPPEEAAQNAGKTTGKDKPRKRRRRDRKKPEDKRAEDKKLETKAADILNAKAQGARNSTNLIGQDELNDAVGSTLSHAPRSNWTISPPSAGHFLDHDPMFVRKNGGEQCLITANDREVQVLSLETSLQVGHHPAPTGKRICCYTIDSGIDDCITIMYDDGTVTSWLWADDVEFQGRFTAKGKVHAITGVFLPDVEKSISFYVTHLGGEHAIYYENKQLYASKQRLESIQVLGYAEYVVARGPSALVLGMRKYEDESMLDFTWLEMPLSTASTSLDARIRPVPITHKKDWKKHSPLSLAIGYENGQIHLFDDVSSLFKQTEQQHLPTPRVLHWHREAVSSVKFSQTGNYLISGGKETVLVIWQLETGKKQYLPHLTSEIERIVVSPADDRYALQMGDNSIMVLSTSELKPVANFAGLQTHTRNNTSFSSTPPAAPAAILHPKHPNRLLLTVPASRPKAPKPPTTRPFLQTFDIRTSRHIARQALTRNNVTDFNLGPERTPIIPPDVSLLAISADGNWMASVDEWMPPSSDVSHLASDDAGQEAERAKRREVFLKVWWWDEVKGLWTLSTRVDAPHARAAAGEDTGMGMGAGRVVGLVGAPVGEGFASIGEEDCVKIWGPRRRRRKGEKLDAGWRCMRTVQLPTDRERADSPMDVQQIPPSGRACLAYSTDGSMLAVSRTPSNSVEGSVVYFIDTATGAFIPKTNLTNSAITTLGFLDRYFIAVSEQPTAAYVWDLVNDTLIYKSQLPSASSSVGHKRGAKPQLAVNNQDGTFALAVQRHRDGKSRVGVYGTGKAKCLYKQDFETKIEALLAPVGARGYTLLFTDATTRTLTPLGAAQARADTHTGLHAPSDVQEEVAVETAGEDVDVDIDMTEAIANAADAEQEGPALALEDSEDDRPVVRPEQLASVFDVGQSYALPSVREMFRAVVGLYGRAPEEVAGPSLGV